MKNLILVIMISIGFISVGHMSYLDIINNECDIQTAKFTGHSANKCKRDAYGIATAESSFFKNASKYNAFGLTKKDKKLVYDSYTGNIQDFVRRWNLYWYNIQGEGRIKKANYNNGKGNRYKNFLSGLRKYDYITKHVSQKLK